MIVTVIIMPMIFLFGLRKLCVLIIFEVPDATTEVVVDVCIRK